MKSKPIRLVMGLLDMFFGTIAGLPLALHAILRATIEKQSKLRKKNALILDISYTLEMIRKRQLQQPVFSRDLNGYFEHVWSVHLCATVIASKNPEDDFGKLEITELAPKHTIVEGKIGRYSSLKHFPLTNFILAQWNIYLYLNNLIKEKDIAVVRAGDPYYQGLIAIALAKAHGIPSVFRIPIHYDLFYKLSGDIAWPRLFKTRRIEKLIDRFTLKRADLVAGSNVDTLNFALDNGARKEFSTVFRIGNLLHRAHFKPPEDRPKADSVLKELGLENRSFSITVSRLESLKQVDDVVRALADVRQRGEDFTSVIVGDGRMKDELIELADSLGVKEHLLLPGNMTQEWIASLIPYASVIISPFMGRGLAEASLSGIPVIAYDVEWQREVVQTGKTGELVAWQDYKGIADAIVKYRNDPDYAKQMGLNVREFILDMMDPDKLTQHEIDQYDKLFKRCFQQ